MRVMKVPLEGNIFNFMFRVPRFGRQKDTMSMSILGLFTQMFGALVLKWADISPLE